MAALLFDLGNGRYAAPPREGDAVGVQAWQADLAQVRADGQAARKAQEAAQAQDLTHTQVQGWLRSNVPGANIAAASSTAAAARDLASMSEDEAWGRAAVCSPLAAEHFGLTVLADGIEDHAGAITRFVLVTREGEGHTGYNKGNACVDTAVEAYLVSGTVPQDGLTCTS